MSNAARTSAPRPLQQTIREEAESLFTTLSPTLARQCREEFARGALEVINRRAGIKALTSDPESEATTKALLPQDTPPRKSLPSIRRTVPTSDPLVCPIEGRTTMTRLSELSFTFGIEVNKERHKVLAKILHDAGWTAAELDLACALIPTDAELCKTISFERTIAPGVFAEAKNRPEVMRGRLHAYTDAVTMSQEANKPLSQCFEAVVVDGEEAPRWMMI
jgi:hypothetical protein